MENKHDALIASRVHQYSYDPETGLVTNTAGVCVGNVKGHGYLCITLRSTEDGTLRRINIYLHRLAWMIHYGRAPAGLVDHINGVKTDNRIANLRLATKSQNQHNRPIQSNNTTGFKGVRRDSRSGRFLAAIKVCGQSHHLGQFHTAQEASAAYRAAAIRLHGEFARV